MGVFAEEINDSLHFGDVTYGGRSAVYVDIVDVLGLHACIIESVAHREDCTQSFGVGGCEVICIGTHAAAGNLGINLGTAGLGVLEFFKYKYY